MENEDIHAHKVSDYELSREERIKENRERMQKLGILDLSLKLNALKPTPKRAYHRKTHEGHSPLLPSGPVRRSSRLQHSTPVSYCEVHVAKKDKSLNGDDLLIEEGSKPEIYTEEHEKLLGSTEMSWILFVDGYGKDGKRIYDPVRGKTCHQCRQKTLGHRTYCSKCKMVQGQFCGDCLFMRYGENVLEANKNPNWICPVCRGICNCSLCRQAKGWPPTGSLYRKISSLGYKSVAHYLIQTRRANPDSDKSAGTKVPVSVKRSLPFSDIEITIPEPASECMNTDPLSEFKEFGDSKGEHLSEPAVATESKDQFEYPVKPEPENNSPGYDNEKEGNLLVGSELDKTSIDRKTIAEPLHDLFLTNLSNQEMEKDQFEYPVKPEPENNSPGYDNDKEGNLLVGSELDKTSIDRKTIAEPLHDPFLTKPSNQEMEKEKDNIRDEKDSVKTETSPKSTKKRIRFEPSPDSIGGRLRQRRNKTNTNEESSTVADPVMLKKVPL